MSVIAVRILPSRIEIAGDTQTSWSANKRSNRVTNDKQIESWGKLFQTNGMTIGCAGSVADIGMLQIFAKTHKPKDTTRDEVIEWVLEFKEWMGKKTKANFDDISIHGILIFEGKAFAFFDFIEVNPVQDYDAVGSGMWLALGAMDVGATAYDAVKTAIKYDLYCGGHPTTLAIPI